MKKLSFIIFSLLLLLVFWSIPVGASQINEQTVTEFLDEFIVNEMEKHQIVGALVAVVDAEGTLFSKGYGYANIEQRKPMDPANSVFRAASISKLFTATALMQLSETGLIDLHANINHYLGDSTVPDTFREPITIHHLLTHTSGFDERFLQVRFADQKMVTPLYDDVISAMPPRIRIPGEVVSYSNYGYALAGHIVEVVSGLTFEEYIEQHIFIPLAMNKSTFIEPPTEHLLENLVTTYAFRGNEHFVIPPQYHNQRPAGALYTTIEDLAQFATANLNNEEKILTKETVSQMQAVQFEHHPKLEGRGYGFYEIRNKGLRVIGHDGDLTGAHSFLFLIPEVNMGLIFHFNTSINAALQEDPRIVLLEQFIERFYPDEFSKPRSEETREFTEVTNLSGHYRTIRYVKKSPGKLLNPNILIQFQVTQDENGKLTMSMPLGMAETTEWLPYDDDLFYEKNTGELLAFSKTDNGKVDYLFFNQGVPMTLERIAWYEQFWVIVGLILSSILIFFLGVVGTILSFVYRLFKKQQQACNSYERLAKVSTRTNCFVGLTAAALVLVMISHVMQTLSSPLLVLLPLVSLLGWFLAINSILLIAITIKLLRQKQLRLTHAMIYGFSIFAGLGFTWILLYSNLLWFASA